jgi:hypothetical protein
MLALYRIHPSLALLTRENARATGHDDLLLIVKVRARTEPPTLIDLARRGRTLRVESRGRRSDPLQAEPPFGVSVNVNRWVECTYVRIDNPANPSLIILASKTQRGYPSNPTRLPTPPIPDPPKLSEGEVGTP